MMKLRLNLKKPTKLKKFFLIVKNVLLMINMVMTVLTLKVLVVLALKALAIYSAIYLVIFSVEVVAVAPMSREGQI